VLKTVEPTHRVKMYKRGRHWVFAGIVTATFILAANPVGAHADTATTDATSPTSEVTTASNAHQETDVTLSTTDVDGHPDTTAPTEIEEAADTQNESDTINDSVTTDATDQDQAEDTQTDTDTTTDTTDVDDNQTTATTTTAEPISATVTPKTQTKTGADTKLKAVKLVKAEVAKPATVKLAHQQRATTIDDWMPNTVLQQAVLKSLKAQNPGQTWNSAADITQDDMVLLKTLSVQSGAGTYIDGKTAFALDGLEFATNLTWLAMGGNLDGSPGAYYGDIVDVTPLAGLTNLETLDLQHNRITDVTPLANLTGLKNLYLAFNRIRDFSPLKGIGYTKFHAGSQMIVLDPIKVSATARTAHLQMQFITIDGDVIQLEPVAERIGDPVFYNNGAFTYRFYFTGGTGVSDGQGGLNYTDLKDQIPGITEYPNVTVEPQTNNYYLTGRAQGSDSFGSYLFAVAQGYDIAEEAAAVTVKYQDEQGKALADDLILPTGMIGEDYTTTPLAITGYTLKTTPENASGQYGTEAITVTYVYKKDGGGTVTPPVVTPTADVTMTVYYQLADGTQLAPSKTISGKPGTTYTTSALAIDGYTLVTTPENATGTFGDTDGTITYVYAKTETGGGGDEITGGGNGENPDTASPNGEKPSVSVTTATSEGGAGATVSPLGSAAATASGQPQSQADTATATTLPQTDEHRTSAWWGVVLLSLTAIGGWLGKRRKQEK